MKISEQYWPLVSIWHVKQRRNIKLQRISSQ